LNNKIKAESIQIIHSNLLISFYFFPNLQFHKIPFQFRSVKMYAKKFVVHYIISISVNEIYFLFPLAAISCPVFSQQLQLHYDPNNLDPGQNQKNFPQFILSTLNPRTRCQVYKTRLFPVQNRADARRRKE